MRASPCERALKLQELDDSISIERIRRTTAGPALLGSVPFYRGIVQDQRLADGDVDPRIFKHDVLAVLYQKTTRALDFEIGEADGVGDLLGQPDNPAGQRGTCDRQIADVYIVKIGNVLRLPRFRLARTYIGGQAGIAVVEHVNVERP